MIRLVTVSEYVVSKHSVLVNDLRVMMSDDVTCHHLSAGIHSCLKVCYRIWFTLFALANAPKMSKNVVPLFTLVPPPHHQRWPHLTSQLSWSIAQHYSHSEYWIIMRTKNSDVIWHHASHVQECALQSHLSDVMGHHMLWCQMMSHYIVKVTLQVNIWVRDFAAVWKISPDIISNVCKIRIIDNCQQ